MLYTILRIQKETDEDTKVEVKINSKHPVFAGHFPSQPVLPGACMVQMMKELFQEARQCKLEFQKGHNIKFISLVVPDEEVPLIFSIQTKKLSDNLLSLSSTLFAGEVASMKFSGTYKVNKV